MIVNSGLPGGCGIPSTYAAAMYSDVSQNWVVGARVATYSTSAPRATQPAIRYGGARPGGAVGGPGRAGAAAPTPRGDPAPSPAARGRGSSRRTSPSVTR